MAIQFSTGLKSSVLLTGSLRAALTNAKVHIYSGAPPASPDDAATGTLLNEYTDADSGLFDLTFEAALDSGSLVKTAAQVWSGTAAATGTAGYFRMIVTGDTGGAVPTEVRIQGTVGGAGADMFLASTSFTSSTLYYIDAFAITIPDL
ncbi:MAG: hypothetical protein P1U54_14875 [Immundisolibacteraceae bacterium]|nr:hypothetical protein [Immundisolibacteraceae bacterium]